jgi:calpain-7
MTTPLDDAFRLLEAANDLEERRENENHLIEAATKYYEACYLMKRYLGTTPMPSTEEEGIRALIQQKIDHYENRATRLLRGLPSPVNNVPRSPLHKHGFFNDESSVMVMPAPPPSAARSPQISANSGSNKKTIQSITDKVSHANSRLSRALDLDEDAQTQRAITEYMAAAELYLAAIKLAEDGKVTDIQPLLKRRLEGALDRLEELKNPNQKTVISASRLKEQQRTPTSSKQPAGVPLTDEEILVLKRSSLIASGLFLPWSDQDVFQLSVDSKKVSTPLYTDPDFPRKLSEKQTKHFFKWARPAEICDMRRRYSGVAAQPSMIKSITPYSIRQQFVTDCSFIASLCICSAFERKFHRKLVTSLIFPQNNEGSPIINPTGKYIVRLWLNGVARQVTVDDFLPVDKHGNLLCSQTSSNGLELWVSLIEKAYMKLCGGYDFPGSNSGVDLFSLTGWIPERLMFPKDPLNIRDHETSAERAWERLYSASSFGDCLITVSTSSEITQEQANATGLVTGHAYAILAVVQTQSGIRLLQLKNPWGHMSWNGKYSPGDASSWSDPQLCKEVGYDPSGHNKDDGVFWISWQAVLIYFQNIHLSWSPSLFSCRVTTHGFWPSHLGPVIDTYFVGDNPQYNLVVSDTALKNKASIWILASRHVSKQEQEGSVVTDYLTIHVHRAKSKTSRIWYPGGKSLLVNGAYTNNPHVLVRYDLTSPEDKYISLVLSQYHKSNDLSYTLSVFSTEAFQLARPPKDPPLLHQISDEWTESTAGGPLGQSTFQLNPMWAVGVPEEGAHLQIRCSADKTFAINIMLISVSRYGERITRVSTEPQVDSGPYKHGFVVVDEKKVPGGYYTMVISTFNPQQIGAFHIKVLSSSKVVKIEKLH